MRAALADFQIIPFIFPWRRPVFLSFETARELLSVHQRAKTRYRPSYARARAHFHVAFLMYTPGGSRVSPDARLSHSPISRDLERRESALESFAPDFLISSGSFFLSFSLLLFFFAKDWICTCAIRYCTRIGHTSLLDTAILLPADYRDFVAECSPMPSGIHRATAITLTITFSFPPPRVKSPRLPGIATFRANVRQRKTETHVKCPRAARNFRTEERGGGGREGERTVVFSFPRH